METEGDFKQTLEVRINTPPIVAGKPILLKAKIRVHKNVTFIME
jgi:hypothetical protein